MENIYTTETPPQEVAKELNKELRSEDLRGTGMMSPMESLTAPPCEPTLPPIHREVVQGDQEEDAVVALENAGDVDFEGHARHLVGCLRGLGCSAFSALSFTGLVCRMQEIHVEFPLEKVIKWLYASSLSIVVGEPLPPCPLPSLLEKVGAFGPRLAWKIPRVLFPGRVGKAMSWMLRHASLRWLSGTELQRKKALRVGQSFLLMKKGTPVVSSALKAEGKKKHRQALRNREKGLHARLRSVVVLEDVSFDDLVLQQITRTVEELFSAKKFEPREGLAPFPSTSGHFLSDTLKGGAAGRILSDWQSAKFTGGHATSPTVVTAELEEGPQRFKHYEGQNDAFREKILTGLDLEASLGFPVLPVQILESLKVRTVTCGPEYSYWLMIELQKFMWKVLKEHKVFELIGKPISADVLQDIIDLKPRGHFLSGDFAAATDNLRKVFSDFCWEEICRVCGIPDWLRVLGLACLTGHTIYEKRLVGQDVGREHLVEKSAQETGQLMGSPLSFPILCVINAVVARMAFAPQYARRKLRWLPIRINGDDCGMRYTESEKEQWEKISAGVGLEPSVGKCYFNASFIQMNSELFYLQDGRFSRIPFFNFGLCRPLSSKGGERRDFTALGSLCRDFVFGAYPDDYWVDSKDKLWELRREAIIYFIRAQKETFETIPEDIKYRLDWYLPKCYGGLGLPERKSFIGKKLTSDQRLFASYLHNKMLAENGGEPQNPFGRWTLGNHPWLNVALHETEKYETRTIIFEDEFQPLDEFSSTNWADLQDEEDAWAISSRLSVYGPVLWEVANRISFSSAVQAEKERREAEKGKTVKVSSPKGDREFFERLNFISRKWRSMQQKAISWGRSLAGGRLITPFTVEDFFRPRHIVTTVHERSLKVLELCVPGPRSVLGSLPVPTRVPDWEVGSQELFFLSGFSLLV